MKLLLREVLALPAREVEESVPGTSMEHVVAGLPEDEALLGVVAGHNGGTGRLLGERDQTVDVLHRLEGFLTNHACNQQLLL